MDRKEVIDREFGRGLKDGRHSSELGEWKHSLKEAIQIDDDYNASYDRGYHEGVRRKSQGDD